MGVDTFSRANGRADLGQPFAAGTDARGAAMIDVVIYNQAGASPPSFLYLSFFPLTHLPLP